MSIDASQELGLKLYRRGKVRDTFELVVQVNGKVRDRIEVAAALAEDELVERALQSDKVRAYLNGKQVRKTIVVPGRLVNLVVA